MTERPSLTVDAVVFHEGAAVLIRRGHEPFRGFYALPGGYVDIGEAVEQACCREALEETGLVLQNLRLIGVYSNPNRDPRRHTVTVAFLAAADISTLRAGDDASAVELVSDWQGAQLAFDHKQILHDAWHMHRSK